jgi:hypothetical protein
MPSYVAPPSTMYKQQRYCKQYPLLFSLAHLMRVEHTLPANESNACGSTRASRSCSFNCTFMLARAMFTLAFAFTNTPVPRYST